MILGLILAMTAGQTFRSADGASFEDAADGLLGRIQAVMEKEGRRALFMDSVLVPKEGTEAGLRKELTDRLQAKDKLKEILVDNKFKADTFLDITLVKDMEGTEALLKARLRHNRDNTEFHSVTSEAITDASDLVRLLNLTVNQRVPGDNKPAIGAADTEKLADARLEQLKQAFSKSQVAISDDGFRASVDSTSPYQIEIRTRDQEGKFKVSQPIKVVKDSSGGDFAFVDLPLGTVFAIRVLNAQTDHDVGVRVTLDGISSLELCEISDYKEHGCWYVRKNEAGTIKGWLVNENLTRSFETSTLADGLITALKQTNLSSVGTINVSFFPAWVGDAEVPAIERTAASKAIKQGQAVENKVNTVNDVHFGKTLLSSITIRYERPDTKPTVDSIQAKR
jgi:hypothetical protein